MSQHINVYTLPIYTYNICIYIYSTHIPNIYRYTLYNIVFIYIYTHEKPKRDLPRRRISRILEKGWEAVGVRALLIDFKYLLRLYSESFLRASRTKNTVIHFNDDDDDGLGSSRINARIL